MNRWHILIILGVTALSLVGLFIISFQFDPFEASRLVKLLFLTSLAIFIWGFGSVIISFIEAIAWGDKRNSLLAYLDRDWKEFRCSFRRGFLISAFIIGLILLKRFEVLSTWTFLVFCIILIFIELAMPKMRRGRDLAESLTD